MPNSRYKLFHLLFTTILWFIFLNKYLLKNAYTLSFKDTKMNRTCCLPSHATEGDKLSKFATLVQYNKCQDKEWYAGTQSRSEGRLPEIGKSMKDKQEPNKEISKVMELLNARGQFWT